ncbi:MAG: lytic transglycosylase domain-containing protein [Hyphomicrobium sp.]
MAVLLIGADSQSFAAAQAPPTTLAAAPASKAAANRAPAAKPSPAVLPQPDAAKGNAVPKPIAATKSEAAYIADIDKAIAPARATDISTADAVRIRDAVAAIGNRNLPKAIEIQAQVTDPIGRKLIDWARLRAGYGDPASYRTFLDANPTWPDRTLITQRLEDAVFAQGGSRASVRAMLGPGDPITAAGWAAVAAAHLADGDAAKAKSIAAKTWREVPVPAGVETAFLDRFKGLLTEADHKWRLDRLLMDESRWQGERSQRAVVVRRLIPLLSAPEQAKAQARLAVYLRASDAKKLIDALPAETAAGTAAQDWGLTLSRIQALRRSKQHAAAAKAMLSAPTDQASIVSPDDWWNERQANAYEALEAGNPKLAYELVSDAGALTVNPLKEQSFMAGWLAFRRLDDTANAARHFAAMRKAADGPLSRAKAEYWLARVAEKQGDKDKANEHYRRAAAETDTFHGQLARLKLEPGRRPITLKPPAMANAEQIGRFNGLDSVKAAVIARKAGLDLPVVRAFLNHLRTVMESEAEVAMVAHLAEALGDTQAAVRIAKSAVARGQNLMIYAYPVHPFPAYTALRPPPEAALLLGIARQESEFNTRTVSGAGAQGLLQVMPITARHVCRDYKIKCDIPRLLTDMAYNTSLASAYIADRMAEFQGSYVLAIAGYNAGPGRARQWIRQFGDPRDPKVDVVDWIERIPFEETRDYVGKVLSNVQIYRARLGEEAIALRLHEDLARAKADQSLPLPIPSAAGSAPAAPRQSSN